MLVQLIVVSGAPASGKTTVATELSNRLNAPLFGKDWYKEYLFDSIGIGNRDWSRQLGSASYTLLYATAERLLSNGISVIIESNFRERDSERVQKLTSRYSVQLREIFCTADPIIVYKRFSARVQEGKRHPGHVDVENLETVKKELDTLAYKSLLDSAIVIDTTDFSAINYEDLERKLL
jgi:predicted kinase